MSNEVTTTFHCKQNIVLESSKPINPQDISVNIGSDNKSKTTSSEPNSLALAILWAHFQACDQGSLTINPFAPWKEINNDKWRKFLNHLITDSTWKDWIQNPEKIKHKTFKAYQKL
ncbi:MULTISPECIES: hypothetical protein [unclassified Candidatus Frackibacter]|uniref:hypothetical protein n=1 Tax=unclassified Candidatus Frackibacter TaxID=2648818 RepID=UPI0007945279|nr:MULTISPECIES: hypothetical protein [unclassified Candidatus Frackibacter]KXS43585.1 MAG: hypothetical protein AWU54_979 [Candidatus Frackibacter sp. T328-2]SDC62616.1 hypothetical protein SAMN04515661_11661 [Candidatus Frackibacter sp. WG11]SEM76355.1 hypothetical protein SAMN04488698_11562 [Candidatus Frackibacter sp. WG12]SFL86180.1 hypothetical protein SAMN04488699_1178 [Candidatus Frackibacter sp. WG13]